jgi:redox-sensing transcriptional repressor
MRGVERVFSYTLANEAGVTPDQVRRDFSEFKIKGRKRGGYIISELLEKIDTLFHRNIDHNLIIIGIGNLGLALMNYSKFIRPNMKIVAAFDIDPSKRKQKTFDIPVYCMSRLEEIILKYNVRVAIVAVPEISVREVADDLVRYGIKGIVNFAPVPLKVPSDIVMNNINMGDELESVIYYVHKNPELLNKDIKY